MRLRAIYIFPQSASLFCWRKYIDRSWDNINRSQTHECWNWGWGRAIPRKGIYKGDFCCSARGILEHFSQIPRIPSPPPPTISIIRGFSTDVWKCTPGILISTGLTPSLKLSGVKGDSPGIWQIVFWVDPRELAKKPSKNMTSVCSAVVPGLQNDFLLVWKRWNKTNKQSCCCFADLPFLSYMLLANVNS